MSTGIAIGLLSEKNERNERPRIANENPPLDFIAMPEDTGFQDKLALVAIDEIHTSLP